MAADPVATAIFDFIREQEVWMGTATELLELLNQSAPKPRPKDWPRQPNGLTKRMNTLCSTFNDAGIRFKQDKGRKRGRKLTLECKARSSSPSSSAPTSPIRAGLPEDGEQKSSSAENGRSPVRNSSLVSRIVLS